MGTRKASSSDNHINLLDKKAVDGSIYRKIGAFTRVCLLFLVNLLTLLFGFMARRFFRINNGDESSLSEPRELNQDTKSADKGEDFKDGNTERRMPAFSFKYQIQNLEDKFKVIEEEEEQRVVENSEKNEKAFMIAAGTSNYRFLSDSIFEEPENTTFLVHESLASLEKENFHEDDTGMRFLYEEDLLKPPYEILGSLYQKERKGIFLEEEKSISMNSEANTMVDSEIRFSSEDFSTFDFESETESSSDGYSVKELVYSSDNDDFLSESDFGEEEVIAEDKETLFTSVNKLEQGQRESFYLEISDDDADNNDEVLPNEEDDVEETIGEDKLLFPVEQENAMKICSEETSVGKLLIGKSETELGLQIEFVEDSSDDELSSVTNGSARLDSFGGLHFVKDVAESESKQEDLDSEQVGKTAEDRSNYGLTKFSNALELPEQKTGDFDTWKGSETMTKKSEEPKTSDFGSEELDELWEHQDLIEQLKMEIKRVKAAGLLPTILEESESSGGIEDLKPFKIDELLHEDPLDELQNFYKSYRESMRKFDILNYQKMYAMGFLQLKNPLHSIGTQRQFFSTIMSHLSQNLLRFCQKKFENNPSEKLIKDLQCDLETVYVGQTCLSWEFLRWQYEKSREILESDLRRSHQYNQVADEFQQFQVLIQRFTENERFEGPRLPNYVKQRCVLRNLLQVPFMKEDFLKDNTETKEDEYVITSGMLEGIMEEAIRVFWEFVKAERDETPLLLKVLVENSVELQDPSDNLFMREIQTNLQKKEKKLKDLLRTGNCIVKKFKKPREDRSNQDLFFSQVDLKLVARVLRMPRISSDQLIWCQKKLSKINFSLRKVHREPSFLLFPC